MYSKEIYDRVTRALNEKNIGFEPNIEDGVVIIRNQNVDSMGRAISILVRVRSKDYIVFGVINDFAVEQEYVNHFVELLMRINRGYYYPKFDFNYASNSPGCEYYFPVYGSVPSTQTVYDSILAVYDHFDRFGKAIISVSMGFQDPQSAYEDATD